MLNLTAPEMKALVGGLRVLNVDVTNKIAGVLTDSTDALSNNFFLKLTDMKYQWANTADPMVLRGRSCIWQEGRYWASLVDLAFGPKFELRAVVKHHGCGDAKEEFAIESQIEVSTPTRLWLMVLPYR